MRTKEEIYSFLQRGGFDHTRQVRVMESLLEVMLDVRDALLDPEQAKKDYCNTVDAAGRANQIADFIVEKIEQVNQEARDQVPSEMFGQQIQEGDIGQEPADPLDFGGAVDKFAEDAADITATKEQNDYGDIDPYNGGDTT